MNNMKLGTKVKCSAYIRKLKIKHVISEDIQNNFDNYCSSEDSLIIEDYLSQQTNEIVETLKPFIGIFVGYKNISMETTYYHEENCYTGRPYLQINKDKYIKCALVYFRLGGSRLIPVENIEVLPDEFN